MNRDTPKTEQLLVEENSTADLPPGVIAVVRGRAGTADQVNANRRLYPAAVYRKAIRKFNVGRRTQADTAFSTAHSEADSPGFEELLGELDHPGATDGPRLEKTAFHITRLQLSEGRFLDFTGHVLDTPHGRTLRALLSAGIPVSVSTRGTGSLARCCSLPEGAVPEGALPAHDNHPHWRVGDDYELHGIDAVAKAAHAGAFMSAALEGSAIPSTATSEERNDSMDLVETSPTGVQAEAVLRISELESQLHSARTDREALQTAAASEKRSLEEALCEARAAQLAAVTDLEEQLSAALADRDAAVVALNRREIEGHVHTLLQSLRPEVRQKVAEQLKSCETPEQVTERWSSIEQVLSAAGLACGQPAGSGQVHTATDSTGAGASATTLTAAQLLQRHLLGIG